METNNGRKYRRDRQFLRLERKPTTIVLSENATRFISNDNAAEPFSLTTRDPSPHAPGVEDNERVGAADRMQYRTSRGRITKKPIIYQ